MNVADDSIIAPRAKLVSATAVVVANHFNLSIFQPMWFLRNGVLREEELTQNVLISPGVVAIPTSDFFLTLLPERLQMQILQRAYPNATAELLRVIGGIVRLLPHTPYAAIGFNFDVTVSPPDGRPFGEWNREGFLVPRMANVAGAASANARFGGYASYDLNGGRLKINIVPVKLPQPGLGTNEQGVGEHMHATFNYHTDVPQPPEPDFVVGRLEIWESVFDEVRNVLTNIG